MFEGRGDDILGQAIQPVRPLAAPACPPRAEPVVAALKSKGLTFEHYDLPGLTRKGDLHVADKFKGAWLKDPDGNILHILSR